MNTRARMKANALFLSDRQIIFKFVDGTDYIGGNNGIFYLDTHLFSTTRYSIKQLVTKHFQGREC